jgi:hypothetical protein
MKMTRERVVYAAVLGAGLLALIVDRAMLSPGEAGAAALAEPASAPARAAESVTGLPEGHDSVSPRHQGLAQRLRSDDDLWLGSIRDGFRAAESWISPPQVQTVVEQTDEEIDRFQRAHRLTAVNAGRNGKPTIIVNGRVVQQGSTLDGWLLLEVTAGSAIFQKGEHRAELELNQLRIPGSARRVGDAPASAATDDPAEAGDVPGDVPDSEKP